MMGSKSRRWGVGAAIFTSAVLVVASVAWACTPLMGKGTLDGARTTSTGVEAGPRGSVLRFTGGFLKSKDAGTGQYQASPTVFRILFLDNAKLISGGDTCMTNGFVMKRADGTGKANNVAAPPKPSDPDPATGQDGAFVVDVKVPTYFPGTTTQVPVGKSKICGMEQSPVLNHTGTVHLTFKVTVT